MRAGRDLVGGTAAGLGVALAAAIITAGVMFKLTFNLRGLFGPRAPTPEEVSNAKKAVAFLGATAVGLGLAGVALRRRDPNFARVMLVSSPVFGLGTYLTYADMKKNGDLPS